MTDLFISHASSDRVAAERLADALRKRQHESFFLDSDGARGIRVGEEWARTLYRRIRACRAVLFLCSAASAESRWCFAELAQARALGKQILPLSFGGHPLPEIISDIQAMDVSPDGSIDDARLWEQLSRIGVADDGFGWDDTRPPYPGIAAFDERDAATFFARREDVAALSEALGRMRLGDAHVAVVVGASGSGKSSVVRAGLIPRLKRNPVEWIVLDPTIAGPDVLEQLAEQLVAAFPRGTDVPSYDVVAEEVRSASSESGTLAELASRVRGARLARDARTAHLVWVVDQAERLLVADAQLADARRLLTRIAHTPGLPLHVVLTLRSDHLSAWQAHAASQDLAFESVPLGPLAPSRFGEIIEGPARLAGLDLGPGLVAALMADAHRPDGLPLLAFVLRELWDRSGRSEQAITLEDYVTGVGGLEGAVGRRAADVVARLRLTDDRLALLRATMCRMARLGEVGFVAQPLPWVDVPDDIRPALERLVDARLLVSRRNVVEVAHDVLFRAWGTLREWLEANRNAHEWRRRVDPQLKAWESRGRNTHEFHLSGAPLQEGLEFLATHRTSLDEATCAFVEASRDRAQREETRLRNAYGTALARQLAAEAHVVVRSESADLLERSLLLAVESMRRSVDLGISTFEADQAIRAGLAVAARPVIRHRAGQRISPWALAVHPRKVSFFSGARDGSTATLREDTGRIEPSIRLDAGIADVAYDADGSRVVMGDESGAVVVLDIAKSETTRLRSPFSRVPATAVAFGPTGRHVAAAFHSHIAVWDLSVPGEPTALEHPDRTAVVSLAFSRDDDVLVAQAVMRDTIGWRWRDRSVVVHAQSMGNRVTFSPDGRFLAICGTTFVAQLLDVFTGELRMLANNAARVAFSGDSRYVAIASPEHFVRIWALPEISDVRTLRHNAEVWDVDLSPDGRRVTMTGKDHVARVWSTEDGRELARMVLPESLSAARFFADSRHVLTLSGDDELTVWDTDELSDVRTLKHAVAVLRVAFDRSGRLLATSARASQTERAATLIDIVAQTGVESVQLTDGREMTGTELASQLLAQHEARFREGVATPDGDLVAVVDGPVVRVQRGGTLVSTIRHERGVLRAMFSPDGRHLATASDHDTARIWEVATGREVSRLTHPDPNVVDVDWSPDGRLVATASWDHTARIWQWRPEDLIGTASSRLARNLTPDEWKTCLPDEPYRETIVR